MEQTFIVRFSRRASCLVIACAPLLFAGGLFVFVKLQEPDELNDPVALRVLQGVCGALFACAGAGLFGFGLKNLFRPAPVFTASPQGLALHGPGAARRTLIPWAEIAAIEKKDVRRPGQSRGAPCISVRLRNAAAFRAASDADRALARMAYLDEKDEIHFSCFHISPTGDETAKRFNEFLSAYGSGEAPPPPQQKGEHWADTVQRALAPGIFAVLFVSFLAAGLGLTGAGVWLLARGHASQRWPQTQARIVESRVVRTESDDGPGYYADIRYEYAVRGRAYSSDRVFVVNEVYEKRERAARLAARHPEGHEARAHYNPKRPADSVLEPGRNDSFFLLPVFGACALGVCGLLFSNRPRRAPHG